MSFDSTRDFLKDLEGLERLPHGKRAEWYKVVRSRWLDGIFHRDRQDPNAVVALHRAASNIRGYEPVIDYEVKVEVTATELTMSPQSAVNLGCHLIAAGTAALRDLGKHSWFLAGAATEEADQ